jgi:hypothetical protein
MFFNVQVWPGEKDPGFVSFFRSFSWEGLFSSVRKKSSISTNLDWLNFFNEIRGNMLMRKPSSKKFRILFVVVL